MFEQVIPEMQSLLTTIGTGFGFIALVTTIGEVMYTGAYKVVVRYIRG